MNTLAANVTIEGESREIHHYHNNSSSSPMIDFVERDEKRSNIENGRWTQEEHETFLECLQLYGREWKKVALHIKTRTPAQIRSHAQKYFVKKQKCQNGIDEEYEGNSDVHVMKDGLFFAASSKSSGNIVKKESTSTNKEVSIPARVAPLLQYHRDDTTERESLKRKYETALQHDLSSLSPEHRNKISILSEDERSVIGVLLDVRLL